MRIHVIGLVLILSALGCSRSDALADNPPKDVRPTNAVPPEQASPHFVVSSDPAQPIIRVATRPRLMAGIPGTAYTLFGDGRLERAETSTQTYVARADSARSFLLDAQEAHELFSLAAAPVLIESDPAQLAAEFERAGSRITDGSIVEVEIRLVSYSRGAVSLAPVERSFWMVEPSFVAKYQRAGGSKAVPALAAIVNGLSQLHAEKEKSQ